MNGEWTMDKRAHGEVDIVDFQLFPRCGRFVAAAAPLALVALTAGWLFLGASLVRAVALWCALALLASCWAILGVSVVRGAGRSRRETYRWAVRAASVSSDRGERAVPSKMNGTRWLSARLAGAMVAVPTLLALWVTLAAADARGTGTSALLAEADAVIEQRPVVKIENEAAEGSSRVAAATSDLTVLLPSATGGRAVPATFQAATKRRLSIGSELYVAYAPAHPELGAIGDDQREDVERQLDGRAVQFGDAWTIAGFWALATLGPLIYWWRKESLRRPPRTVGSDWKALRVTVTGTVQHTDAPPPGSAEAADEKKRRDNTRVLRCLVLEGREQRVPFHAQMAGEPAGAVLTGAQGWLLWHPDQRRGRDVLADLVGDDGWQLPGAVPAQVAEQMEEAGVMGAPHPDPEHRVQLLDLGAGWLATASALLLAGITVALGCLTVLLLVPDSGAWRVWTAAGGVLALLVTFTAHGVSRMDRSGDATV
ncbi:hypothetical protein [Streptomyces sp. NPDC093990]|uniref:hypothetical protein n=1 Tax=Streptomyces sp. NPDC093990 TaxID=3155306 RepID=UPI0034331708